MTRIVAGAAGGRRLAVPRGPGTRPTSERAREALFSTLASLLGRVGDLGGARVLDLYAGSGALGLEAASRGAAAVTLVESDLRAVAVLRANAAAVGLPGLVVLGRRVEEVLAGPPQPYDVVLADPPYALADSDLVAVLRRLAAGWLADGAVVVVERPTRGGPVPWPAGVRGLRARRYGEATLWYGRAALGPGAYGDPDPRPGPLGTTA